MFREGGAVLTMCPRRFRDLLFFREINDLLVVY